MQEGIVVEAPSRDSGPEPVAETSPYSREMIWVFVGSAFESHSQCMDVSEESQNGRGRRVWSRIERVPAV